MAVLALERLTEYTRYLSVILISYIIFKLFYPVPKHTSTGIIYHSRIPVICYFRYLFRGPALLAEGHRTHFPKPFALPLPGGPEIILTSLHHIIALTEAQDSVVSSTLNTEWALQGRHTLPGNWESGHPHWKLTWWAQRMHTLVRAHLNPSELESLFPIMLEESLRVLEDLLPSDKDWTQVDVVDLAVKMVARVSSRILVGTKLCRDEEYLREAVGMARVVVVRAGFLSIIPERVRAVVGWWVMRGMQRRMRERLLPVIQELWDNPDGEKTILNGFLSTPGINKQPDWMNRLAQQIQCLNFASLHTTALNLAHCLHHLAHSPTDSAILLSSLPSFNTSTYTSFTNNHTLNSFLKEAQRTTPLSSIALPRLLLRPLTLPGTSDTPSIPIAPPGRVSAVLQPLLLDPSIYPNPLKFDTHRFSTIRQNVSRSLCTKMQAVEEGKFEHTCPTFAVFGAGVHKCTGRWLASLEIGMLVMAVIDGYELKAPPGLGMGVMGFKGVQKTAVGFGWAWIVRSRKVWIKKRA